MPRKKRKRETYKIALQYAWFKACKAAVTTAGLNDWLIFAAPALTAAISSATLVSDMPASIAA